MVSNIYCPYIYKKYKRNFIWIGFELNLFYDLLWWNNWNVNMFPLRVKKSLISSVRCFDRWRVAPVEYWPCPPPIFSDGAGWLKIYSHGKFPLFTWPPPAGPARPGLDNLSGHWTPVAANATRGLVSLVVSEPKSLVGPPGAW